MTQGGTLAKKHHKLRGVCPWQLRFAFLFRARLLVLLRAADRCLVHGCGLFRFLSQLQLSPARGSGVFNGAATCVDTCCLPMPLPPVDTLSDGALSKFATLSGCLPGEQAELGCLRAVCS